MRHSFCIYTAALLAGLTTTASAEVTFEWATVVNPGNAEDPLNAPGGSCEPSSCIPGIGSVADVYRIAKHEVTNDQYTEFLNAVAATDTNGLYHPSMGSNARGGITQSGSSGSFTYAVKADMGNKPVNNVSFFDAMRFVNWLHNGQPTGAQDASTTEDGVYTISDGVSETRAVDAQFFSPTENEWYKAAYHHPAAAGGDTDDYWLYPTGSNGMPTPATANATGDISNPGSNVANYVDGADWNGQNGNVTTVGSAGPNSESFYGTSDQGGNVREWNETLVGGSSRGLRGGSWQDGGNAQRSPGRGSGPAKAEFNGSGFRVASPVPPITRAGAPHNILKNKYISIDLGLAARANPDNLQIRLKVVSSEVIGLVGTGPWWASDPFDECIAIVTKTKPALEPDWSACPVVHLGGCPIVPTTTYSIQVESGGTLSTPVLLDTQAKPGAKWHGDVVGKFDRAWGPPNGTVNADDFLSAIKTFLNPAAANATHTSVGDVAPNEPGTQVNRVVSIEDVLIIIKGFKGSQIPGKDLTLCP